MIFNHAPIIVFFDLSDTVKPMVFGSFALSIFPLLHFSFPFRQSLFSFFNCNKMSILKSDKNTIQVDNSALIIQVTQKATYCSKASLLRTSKTKILYRKQMTSEAELCCSVRRESIRSSYSSSQSSFSNMNWLASRSSSGSLFSLSKTFMTEPTSCRFLGSCSQHEVIRLRMASGADSGIGGR